MTTEIRGVIFDIDGVLEFKQRVCDRAVETIDLLRKKGIVLRFLTNSTLKSRKSCARKLRSAGFDIREKEVITASYATALYLKQVNPRSCWVMLEREGADEFVNFHEDLENPEYIVVGDNRSRFDFDHLNKALRLLLGGAKLVGMQSELTDTSMGEVELNVGSWVEMLARAARVEPVYIGKPNSYVFDLTVKTMGLDKKQVIMVGDRLNSDVKGAADCGMRSVLVKTGEFKEKDLKCRSIVPDFVVASVKDVPALLDGMNSG